MKNFLNRFQWGRFDKNDLKHAGLGLVVFAVSFIILLLPIPTEWKGVLFSVQVAVVWDVCQHIYGNKVKIDIKDIVVTASPGVILCLTILKYIPGVG